MIRSATSTSATSGVVRPAMLALAGIALAGTAFLGITLPLSLWRQPRIVWTDRPLASVLGADLDGALRFALPVLCAFLLYGVSLVLARRLSGLAPRIVVLAITALLAVALLPMNPLGAHDVYHNVASARALWLYGDNPLIFPPDAYPNDPFFRFVPAWQTTPSVYGPLWYLVAGLPLPLAGGDLWSNVLGQKALTAALLVCATLFVMLIAARISSEYAVAAGVLVGWNPLLQFETAGNAHNDVLMVLFVLCALYALCRGWWVAVFPLLALSIASKYVFAVFCPLVLVWMLTRPEVPRRDVLLSLLAGGLVSVLLFAPFLAGTDLYQDLLRESAFPSFSPSAFLHAIAARWLGIDSLSAFALVKLLLLVPFAAGYGSVLLRVRRRPTLRSLIDGWFWSVALILLCVSGWFGPWYAVLLVPFGAILADRRPAVVSVVFSLSAMLMYVPYFWLLGIDPILLNGITAGVAFLPPVLVALHGHVPFRIPRYPGRNLRTEQVKAP
jgi:alpha-1,6-mannosyltransferase